MAFSFSPKTVTRGLSLYMDAGNPNSCATGSASWLDLTANGNNGILASGSAYNSGSSGLGGNVTFDGTDDFVAVTSTPSIQNQTFTFCAWVNPFAEARIRSIISNRVGGGPQFRIEASNNLALIDQGNVGMGQSSGVVTNGVWNHVCVTYINPTIVFYINGTSSGGATLGRTFAFGSLLGIGYGTENSYFRGNMAQVQMYNRALTALEIRQNYNVTKIRYI
jgi:hypothetical protein